MENGTIARIIADKGFGFIKQDGGDKDLFFHSKDCEGVEFDNLQEGQKVTFEVKEGPKGPAATNVNLATAE